MMANTGGSTPQNYGDAERSIKRDGIKPVYLLAGRKLWADSYLRDRFINKIKKQFGGEESTDYTLEIFHAASDKADIILNSLSTANLFTSKKLIVIHDVQRLNQQGLKGLTQYMNDPNLDNCVILVSMNFDARKKWFLAIKKSLMSVKIETPFANQIPKWITLFANNRGKKISHDASGLIFDYSGDSLQMIDMEMEKLSIFVGDKELIEENDVKGAIGFSKQLSPFDLEKYFAVKDLNWALSSIDNMLERGEKATSLTITIYNFIMNTLLFMEDGGKSNARWSPREELKKDAARHWRHDELIQSLKLIRDADRKIKQTRIPHRVILTTLVIKMLSKVGDAVV